MPALQKLISKSKCAASTAPNSNQTFYLPSSQRAHCAYPFWIVLYSPFSEAFAKESSFKKHKIRNSFAPLLPRFFVYWANKGSCQRARENAKKGRAASLQQQYCICYTCSQSMLNGVELTFQHSLFPQPFWTALNLFVHHAPRSTTSSFKNWFKCACRLQYIKSWNF